MLGTNDSNAKNLPTLKTDYVTDYKAMIDTFASLDSHPEIWICTIPPVFVHLYDITEDVVRNECLTRIAQVAKEKNVKVIDVHAALANHPELSSDTVHPNTNGAALLAKTVADALTAKPN